MDQQTAVTKITKELKIFGDYSTEQLETFRTYLNMAYSIGYNEGNSLRGRPRPIVQLTMSGIKIRDFNSIAEASRILGIHQANLITTLKGRVNTSGGFKFAYKT